MIHRGPRMLQGGGERKGKIRNGGEQGEEPT